MTRPTGGRRWTGLSWLVPFVLPVWWWVGAGQLAIGRRTGDLVSHVWAVWNGTLGDPTRSAVAGWPDGIDLLPIYGGWLHTFVGVGLARALGLDPVAAYSAALALVLVVAGFGGHALARAFGLTPWPASVGGLLLQLDGFVLYNAVDGRPEHAGLGFIALALAGAVSCWRRPGAWRVGGCGLAGALVPVVSWEHALWLGAAMVVVGASLWWSGRPAGALRRWGTAALVAAVVAAPWLGAFLVRALAVRELDEGLHTAAWSADQALPLLGWLVGRVASPPRLAMATLLLVPWTARSDRRLWAGLLVGLLLSLVFALGPSPGLWRAGDVAALVDTGPFALVDLPIPEQGVFAEQYQLFQALHGRPVTSTGFMAHLAQDRTPEVLAQMPLLAWASGAPDAPSGVAPAVTAGEVQAVLDHGVRFVALHPRFVDQRRRAEILAGLRAGLGEPALQEGTNAGAPVWVCWDLARP